MSIKKIKERNTRSFFLCIGLGRWLFEEKLECVVVNEKYVCV